MPKFDLIPLTAKRRLGGGCIAVDVRDPEIAAVAKPGQFVMVRATEGVDTITPRPLSIFARVRENGKPTGFTLLVKIIGPGTRAIDERQVGQAISVAGPFGEGLEPDPGRFHLLVAGGTGIAPVAFAAQELARAGGSFEILYGGGGKQDVHLDELRRAGLEARSATEDGSLGFKGLVTELLERRLDDDGGEPLVFACGPWEMMRRAAAICRERGIECLCSLERYMACGFGVCLSCVFRKTTDSSYHTCCQEGPVVNGLEVDWDA